MNLTAICIYSDITICMIICRISLPANSLIIQCHSAYYQPAIIFTLTCAWCYFTLDILLALRDPYLRFKSAILEQLSGSASDIHAFIQMHQYRHPLRLMSA